MLASSESGWFDRSDNPELSNTLFKTTQWLDSKDDHMKRSTVCEIFRNIPKWVYSESLTDNSLYGSKAYKYLSKICKN
jgi:hypothetical protein